jgi:hypothetical protein
MQTLLLRRLSRLPGLRWRYSNPPPTWRVMSPYIYIYIYPSWTGWSSPKSKSKVTVTLQLTVSMSRYRAHSGTRDQILHSVRRLFSESYCLVSVGRPLWREVGSVICHSQCIVMYQYLHQEFTLHVFYSSAIYIQYIQSFIQSRLSTTDYALLVIISSEILQDSTLERSYKWPPPPLISEGIILMFRNQLVPVSAHCSPQLQTKAWITSSSHLLNYANRVQISCGLSTYYRSLESSDRTVSR